MKNRIKWYRNSGINIIPLREKEKVPLVAWDEFMRRETSDREVEVWLARGIRNFGAVCGSISNNLFVIDVDRKELFSKLSLGELASQTFTVKTGKGYHIYLRMPDPKKKSLVWNGHEEIRFQGDGKYVVCEGSIHPNGMIYEHLITSPQIIKRVDSQILDEIEQRWEKYHGIGKMKENREEIKLKTNKSSIIEDFKRRVSLTDVISQYVSKVNDYGTYWQGHCPFHHDRNPSFTVYEDTRSYYCFGCEEGGDVISFIEKKEGKEFFDAIKRIEEKTGVECLISKRKEMPNKQDAKLRPSDIEEMIQAERGFATLRDTEEVLHYENSAGGVWRFNGEVIIREKTQKIVKDLGKQEEPTRYFVSEVIGNVQRETYIDRTRLNLEKKKINLLNGVYNLETDELLPHDAAYYFTSLVPVRYNPDAKCPEIVRFMKEILHKDDIMVVFQFIGYCLLPIMQYHKALMFLGSGANGKSTLVELIRRFLGAKNTTSHSLQSLIDGRFTTADLYGKLANLYADIPRDALRRTGVFKILTGGDTLSAERKFKDAFSFKNTAKLIFSANVLPEAMDDTEAFFRRWLLINFPNSFEGKQCNPDILEKLTTPNELSGLLNLVLDSLKQLLRVGMFHKSKPTAVIREEYIEKSNPVLSFIKKCLEFDPDSFKTKDEVYSAFIDFCGERKLPSVSKSAFSLRLPRYIRVREERRRIEGNRTRGWRGIRFKDDMYSCEDCGAELEDYDELTTHQANCDAFQTRQCLDASEEKKAKSYVETVLDATPPADTSNPSGIKVVKEDSNDAEKSER